MANNDTPTGGDWNRPECPHCDLLLTEQDVTQIDRFAGSMRVGWEKPPNGFWRLACGHRVQILIEWPSEGERFNFRLATA